MFTNLVGESTVVLENVVLLEVGCLRDCLAVLQDFREVLIG
jgi:hypothetical protein